VITRLVVDIETLALPFASFDASQQQYILKFASTDAERDEAILRLALSPFTARTIAIGMVNPDTGAGMVLYDGPGDAPAISEDGMTQFVPDTEHGMLEQFWETAARFTQVITFNGRSFDCPFLMVRSAILGVRMTRDLMGYRYASSAHCDLLEQLSFYGAARRFSLDFVCKAFGIVSPKEEGITGLDLGRLTEEGRHREIAEYCMRDVRATAELWRRWEQARPK
jgi:3'-5' exonuclease